MEGWKYWEGKKVYIILKNGRKYQGVVTDIDNNSLPLIWLSIKDKFQNRITFSIEEIEVIQEEGG